MKLKKIYFYLLLVWLAVVKVGAFAQNISNEGTDFWTVFPTHDPSQNALANMNINVTSKEDSEVTVSCGSWKSLPTAIPANTIVKFSIPRNDSYIDASSSNQPLNNRGIRILVTTGKPKVVVYGHIYERNRSAATLILPFDALGQEYFSMNYTQDIGDGTSKNFLALVAVEDNTKLILQKTDGSVLPIELASKGDVYQYMPANREDLTGTFVKVDPASPCQRFAAFSGSSSVSIGCTSGRDPLLQQLYAVNSWGKTYGIVPFINRRYIVRILAQEDNTSININGIPITTIMKGKYFEQIISDAVIVSADKLISVAQYSFSVNCSSVQGTQLAYGDPEMVLLNPIEFNIKNITLFASDDRSIFEKYINVFMKSTKTSTFRVNDVPPAGNWTAMPSDPNYSYIQIKVQDQSLTLKADDGFNAIVYGFGSTESYAYSAGTNLYSTSTLALVNSNSGLVSTSSACLGQPTSLKLTVPYPLTQITWNLPDGVFTDNQLAPPIITGDPSSLIYSYTSINKTFTNVGLTKITAIAQLSNPVPCLVGTDMKFDFEIDVVPLGVANFIVPDICAGAPVTLKDDSKILDGIISQWEWKIDGTSYNVQNPTHTFAKQGIYKIELAVANASGCWSDVASKSIQVFKDFPKLEFKPQGPVCIKDNPIQLIAKDMRLEALTTSFMGKGVSSSGVFNPSDAGVGTHTITYSFTSNAATGGCTDSISQNIEVYATTEIDMPNIMYILLGGERVMPGALKSPNPAYKYKYKWTPDIGLSNANIINPVIKPESDTRYTLTVSIDGYCDVSQEILVKVLNELSPPNSFSPNGDGINDVWQIPSLDSYPNSEITVFNRSGQRVFFSKGYSTPFDGTFQNKQLPVGVYFYRISPNNGRNTISGSLTIIR